MFSTTKKRERMEKVSPTFGFFLFPIVIGKEHFFFFVVLLYLFIFFLLIQYLSLELCFLSLWISHSICTAFAFSYHINMNRSIIMDSFFSFFRCISCCIFWFECQMSHDIENNSSISKGFSQSFLFFSYIFTVDSFLFVILLCLLCLIFCFCICNSFFFFSLSPSSHVKYSLWFFFSFLFWLLCWIFFFQFLFQMFNVTYCWCWMTKNRAANNRNV